MAWTAPKTWAASDVLTAEELNTYLRDNMAEMAAAKARDEGSYFVTTATNEITERVPQIDRVNTSESTASTSWVDLTTAGPEVTATTGAQALIMWGARMENDNAFAQCRMSWAISGATTRDATVDSATLDIVSVTVDGLQQANSRWSPGGFDLLTDLNPGENTFTAKYRAGGAGTAIFAWRWLIVVPL